MTQPLPQGNVNVMRSLLIFAGPGRRTVSPGYNLKVRPSEVPDYNFGILFVIMAAEKR
jgi:hypothetical protein